MAKANKTNEGETIVTNNNNVNSKEIYSKDDLISLAKEMAKEMMVEELAKIETPKKKTKGALDVNLLVKIKSNIDGLFVWSTKKGSSGVNIRLENYGDTDWLSINELRDVNRWSKILTSGKLILEEVDSDETNLDDVIQFLGLSRIYNGDGISPADIEEVMTKKDVGQEKFYQMLEYSNEVGETILDLAQVFKKKGKIKETYKLDALRAKVAFQNKYNL